MESTSLSRRDENVLEKMKDPESNPLMAVLIDSALPRDPNIHQPSVYERVSQRERDIVVTMQQLEMQLAGLKTATPVLDPTKEYKTCVAHLGQLIAEYPQYASARNNRAQALRRLYGDGMLLRVDDPKALAQGAQFSEKKEAAAMALSDLDEAVKLLTPKSLFSSISPQASKTLALSHTQRAALYHITAKGLPDETDRSGLSIHEGRKEIGWSKMNFEEAASRDFALGGRYGNEIAKGLAVATNPTAKLCGQMVREAMKKEYGPAFEV
ncbi:hypothetical protein PG991_012731 [Apiospora marii]|uniref:Tetratricopeptide repeat protein 36-like protein n=1 Tax=Apiospora marii TaxID=335849 RepID=A0ABR1RAM1_9PEZI